MEKTRKRDTSLDIIKTIAIMGVPLIHAAAVGFYGYPMGSSEWFTSVFWGNILRSAVPLFLMVTGALFFNPEKEFTGKTIYSKYILRIVASLIVWASLYEVFNIALEYKVGNVTDIFDAARMSFGNVVLFKHHFHLYYLQIVIIVYALIPIVRVFTFHATQKQMKYAILVWVAFTVIYPFLRHFAPLDRLEGIPTQYEINMTYGAIGYSLLGYYIKKYGINKNFSWCYLIGLAVTIGGTIIMCMGTGELSELFYSVVSPGVFLMALGVFAFVMNRKSLAEGNIFTKISKASFCIYLVHDFFNIIFAYLGFDAMYAHPVISVPVLVIVNFVLSYVVYLILSKIPVVNKYLI
ncbi:MAG: acyltransferase family protein [Clostridia bacterium]|nr:acyltransferase family protein [Clostridia bacterium]